MNLSRRDLGSQATLVFYEVSLVPLSILATFFVLSFVGGFLVLTRTVAAWVGIGAALVNGFSALVVALTGIAMVATGGTVVYGYQHFFDRSFGKLGPVPVLAVPLVGFVGSAGYALVHLGTLSPPWWVSLIVVLCVHALAFRAIAVYSMLAGTRRSGTKAGIAAAVPATVALVTLVTRHLLDAGWNEVGQRVADVFATTGGSLGLVGLVVLPAMIATAYGLYCTREGIDSLRGFDVSPPTVSADGVLRRLAPVRSALRFRSGDRSDGGTDGRGPSGRARPSGAPPPSSPNIDDSKRSSATGSAAGESGPARSVFRGGGGDPDDEPDAQSADGAGESGNRSVRSGGRDRTGGDDAGEATDRRADSRGGADDQPSRSNETSPADDEPSGAGSDTRIFTDDFGQYDGAVSAVETCPDCEAEIPSDGEYRYCPQCGAEL